MTENLSGIFGSLLIADEFLLVDCANESDSDDDEYDVENDGTVATAENEQTPRQTQIQTTPVVSSTSTESAANTKRSAPE